MSSSLAPVNQGMRSETRAARREYAVGGVDRDLQQQARRTRCGSRARTARWWPGRRGRRRWRCRDERARRDHSQAPVARRAGCAARRPVRIGSAGQSATTAGKSRHTGTPQKCVPSVQRGETRPLRIDAGRADMAADARVRRAHLREFVHRCEVDLLLRVEAGAQRPLVQQRQQRARLDEAQRLGVRQDVERELQRHAELEQPVLRRPRLAHRLVVDRLGPRVGGDQPRRDVVGPRRCRQTSSAAATPAPCGAAGPASRRCDSDASRTRS